MTSLRESTCCFTGHREIPPGEGPKILTRVRYLVRDMLSGGVLYFGVGGACGFDMMVSEFLLDLRDRDKNEIKIISVLPFPDYMEDWAEEDRRRQEEIIRRSDKVVWISQENHKGVYLERDRKLVDGSAYCISYCHRLTGGTAYTVRYAMQQGVRVLNACSWDLRQMAGKENRSIQEKASFSQRKNRVK